MRMVEKREILATRFMTHIWPIFYENSSLDGSVLALTYEVDSRHGVLKK